MALQQKRRPQTAVNWITRTDDSTTKQNKYQDKYEKNLVWSQNTLSGPIVLLLTLCEGNSTMLLLLTHTSSTHFKL